MKIKDVIDSVRRLRPGCVLNERDAIEWLKTLDGIIKLEIIDTHINDDKNIDADEYNAGTELLVQHPYDSDIYTSYLCAQIDRINGEMTRFNNEMALFENAYQKYADFFNRTHMPKGQNIRW